jgi:hypothetical protein
MNLMMHIEFSGEHVTLDAPDEKVTRIVFLHDAKMRVKAVPIHFHVEAAPLTFWTNLYHSALDSGSFGKNCVVRDQSFPFPKLHPQRIVRIRGDSDSMQT